MADGRVDIETRLDNSNIRSDVEATNRELGRIGNNMSDVGRQMNQAFGSEFTNMSRDIRSGYSGISDESRRMHSEMRDAFRQQSLGMGKFRDDMIKAQYGYFQLAQSSKDYTGTTQDFINSVDSMGKQHKAATDAMINGNRLQMTSMLQTVGTMANMSTQAEKITKNYQRMANPMYLVNSAGLSIADSLNRMANNGNAARLALEALGPTASMKELRDMQMMITQGMMRFQMVALGAVITAGLFYKSLHDANMAMDPKYAEAYNTMIEKLTKALQPMRDAFTSLMVPIYNFVSAMADLVIQFNEAHPHLAKFLQGMIMLVPALTVILSPLAVGIGLFAGYRAALNALWMFIGPVVTGLAAMSGTVWLVAAAIAALAVGLPYLYNHFEPFKNAVDNTVTALKAFFALLTGNTDKGAEMLKALGMSDETIGKITGFVDKVKEAFGKLKDAVVSAFQGDFSKLGQIFADIGPSIAGFILGGIPAVLLAAARLAPAIAEGLTSHQDQIINAINSAITNMTNFIVTQLPVFVQKGLEIVQNLALGLANALPVIVQSGITIIQNLITGVTQAGPSIMSAMSSIMSSIIQIISAVLPTLINSGVQIIQMITTGISQTIPVLVTAFTNAFSQISQFIIMYLPTLITTGMQLIQNIIIGISQSIPLILGAANTIISSLVNGIIAFLPILMEVSNTIITTITTAISTYLPILIDIGVQILTNLINGIVNVIPMLLDVATTLITTFLNVLATSLPMIIEAGVAILNGIITGITSILPFLIDTAVSLITNIVNTISNNLPKIIDSGIKVLNSLIDGIINVLPKLIDTAVTLIAKIVETIANNLPKIIDSGVKLLNSLISGILKILPSLIDTAVKLIVTTVNTIVDNLPKIVDAGVKLLTSLIEGIASKLPSLVSKIIELNSTISRKILENLPTILDAGAKLINSLILGILSMVGQLISTIAKDIGNSILDTIKSVNLFDIGANIIKGLINGLGSMASSVLSKAREIANSVKDTIQSAFNIHSPSRWMRDMIGKNMMIGWQIGIDREKIPTLKKVEDMVSWMSPKLPEISKKIDVSGTSSVSPTPTVKIIDGLSNNQKQGGGDTYYMTVELRASDLEEMQSVYDFFDKLKQSRRARGVGYGY